jgi:hypothetical protein
LATIFLRFEPAFFLGAAFRFGAALRFIFIVFFAGFFPFFALAPVFLREDFFFFAAMRVLPMD